jgi:bacterial/archaeal transporter family protein
MSNNWVVYALLSAFFAALVAIFGKMGLKDIDANTATAIRAVIMALFLVALVVTQGKLSIAKSILGQPTPMFYILISGLAGALSWLFYFLALKNGRASQIVPIDRLSVVFTIILAFVILNEKISVKTVLGGFTIVIGAILVALG